MCICVACAHVFFILFRIKLKLELKFITIQNFNTYYFTKNIHVLIIDLLSSRKQIES